MKNENDAKFIKGIINHQLRKEPWSAVHIGGFAAIKQPISGEFVVDFNVTFVTDSIKELLDDVQNITKRDCLIIKNKENIMIRIF